MSANENSTKLSDQIFLDAEEGALYLRLMQPDGRTVLWKGAADVLLTVRVYETFEAYTFKVVANKERYVATRYLTQEEDPVVRVAEGVYTVHGLTPKTLSICDQRPTPETEEARKALREREEKEDADLKDYVDQWRKDLREGLEGRRVNWFRALRPIDLLAPRGSDPARQTDTDALLILPRFTRWVASCQIPRKISWELNSCELWDMFTDAYQEAVRRQAEKKKAWRRRPTIDT